MTVKELITELKKCNPDDIVMYDAENAIKNVIQEKQLNFIEFHYSVDDVLIGSGTIKEFVYLSEELL